MSNIAILTTSFTPNIWNGLGRHSASLASALSRSHRVTVFCPAPSTEPGPRTSRRGTLTVVEIPVPGNAKKSSLPLASVPLWNKLLREQLDRYPHPFHAIILTSSGNWGAVCTDHWREVPTVGFANWMYARSNWIKGDPDEREVLRNEREYAEGVTLLCTHSEHMAEHAANLWNRNVHILPCVLPDGFSSRPLGEQEPNRVCFVGRLGKNKYLETAIRALTMTAPEVSLEIATPEKNADYANHLTELARKLKVGGRVKVLGWLSAHDTHELYRRSQLALVSGSDEAYGYGALDPQSLGTVTLANEYSGLADYLAHPDYSYSNIGGLSQLIDQHMRLDPETKTAMRLAAQAHVTQFNSDSLSAMLEALLL